MKLRILAIASAAVFVAACGSSKKSTPAHVAAHDVTYTGATGAVTISNPAQAATVASGAYTSLTQVTSVNDFTSAMGVSAAPTFSVPDVVRAIVNHAPALAAADQATGATQTASQACSVSGTISGTLTAQDPNYPFTHSGDSASITFNLCNEGGGTLMDGTVSITVNAADGIDFMGASGSTLTLNYTYSATLAFGDLTIATSDGHWMGMDGNITMSVAKKSTPTWQVEESVSGTGLAYAVGQGSTLLAGSLLTGPNGTDQYLQKVVSVFADAGYLNHSYDDRTVNGKVCSVAMGGCVKVVTVTPVRDYPAQSNPSQGYFVITSGNFQINFNILSATNVDVGYDLNIADNGATDPTPLTTAHATWTCLQANNCVFP